MATFSSSTTIKRPVEDVFTVMSNPANDHRWSSAVVEAALTSPGPVGVGTTARYVGKTLGRRFESEWEITEFEPNRKLVARSHGTPVPLRATMTFEPVSGGTLVTVAYEAELSGLYKLGWPLLARFGKGQWQQALPTLKDLMEANAL